MKTEFTIIRHGESTGNLSNTFAGQIDVPLTEKGILQGKCTAEFLKDRHFDMAYSSVLQRAYDTACFSAKLHGLTVVKHTALNEIDGGLWEGLSYPDIREKFPEQYGLWLSCTGLVHCNGGESPQIVGERVFGFMAETARLNPDKSVLIATHAMALRAFVTLVKGIPFKDMQAAVPWASNASVTYVTYENGRFTVKEYGYDKHLEKAGIKTDLHTRA